MKIYITKSFCKKEFRGNGYGGGDVDVEVSSELVEVGEIADDHQRLDFAIYEKTSYPVEYGYDVQRGEQYVLLAAVVKEFE